MVESADHTLESADHTMESADGMVEQTRCVTAICMAFLVF
jgi:hypothetical protein